MAGTLWLALCAGRVASGRAEGQGPQLDLPPDAVTVEAIGFAVLRHPGSVAGAHREALLDARRNVLDQAHVVMATESLVEDMRLIQRAVRSRAVGYIEKIHIWEAGIVPDSEPPLYRVHIRAIVRPLPQFEAAPPSRVAAEGDPWRPVVALELRTDLPAEQQQALRAVLAETLDRCGIALCEAAGERPAIMIQLGVSAGTAGGTKWLTVDWRMGAGEGAPQEGPAAAPPVEGHWLLTERERASGDWWEQLGISLAQDAVRLWNLPRQTEFVFVDPGQDRIARLSAAFGPAAEVRAEEVEGSVRFVAAVPVAGDPMVFVGGALARADLADQVQLQQASLARLTFTFPPAVEQPPAEEAQGD